MNVTAAHLIQPTLELKDTYIDFYEEWKSSREDMVPWVIEREPYDFQAMIQFLEDGADAEKVPETWVPASTFWLVSPAIRVLGVVNIRHKLTATLLNSGGNIGYGIRPSERRKGYATLLLALALDKAREIGIKRALLTCDKSNTGSERTILKNGGKFESEYVEDSGNVVKRFWITL